MILTDTKWNILIQCRKSYKVHNMQKIIFKNGFIALAFISFILISCGKSTSELITGKWKIEDITSPQPNFKDMPDSTIQYYKTQIEIKNTLILTTGYYEFKKNGKCFFELDGERSEGKWRLSDDEKKLMTKEKAGIKETEFEIKELSDGVLIIESTYDGETVRMVMKKEIK